MKLIDIVLAVLIAAAVTAALVSIIKDRRAGRTSCGGNCSACGHCCRGKAPERR